MREVDDFPLLLLKELIKHSVLSKFHTYCSLARRGRSRSRRRRRNATSPVYTYSCLFLTRTHDTQTATVHTHRSVLPGSNHDCSRPLEGGKKFKFPKVGYDDLRGERFFLQKANLSMSA